MFGRIIEESAIVCENVFEDIMKDVRRQKKLGTSSYVRDTRGEFWAKGMVCLTGGDRDIWFAVEGCFNPKRSDYKPFHIQANPFIRYLNGPVKPVDSEKLARLNRFSPDGRAESSQNKTAQVPRQKVLTEEQKERLDQVSKNVENMKTQLAEMSQQLQERREKVAAERAAKRAAEQQESAKKSVADSEPDSETGLQSPVDKNEGSSDVAPDSASRSTENSEKPTTPPSASTSKPPSSRPSGPSAS